MYMNIISLINNSILSLNNSKFFAGLIMILMNVGSRYVTFKFSKTQEEYFKNNLAREILIFAFSWMATRDIYISIMITASFVILADYLFNESSRYCVLPEKYKQLSKIVDSDNDGFITEEEIKKAEETLIKAKNQQRKLNQLQAMNGFYN